MINRKSKRGQSNNIGWLIVMIVAIAVLVITATGFIKGTNPISDVLSNLFPSLWGGSTPGLVEDGALRYVVSQDSVQYYNGAKWLGFSLMNLGGPNKESAIQIENRIYKEAEVKEVFEKLYFGARISDPGTEIKSNSYNENYYYAFVDKGSLSFFTNAGPLRIRMVELYGPDKKIPADLLRSGEIKPQLGDTLIDLYISVPASNHVPFPGLILSVDGKLYKALERDGNPLDSSNAYYQQVRDYAASWRDSVLKQPISLAYTTYEKDSITGQIKIGGDKNNYCIEKIDSDLVVRLSSETQRSTCA